MGLKIRTRILFRAIFNPFGWLVVESWIDMDSDREVVGLLPRNREKRKEKVLLEMKLQENEKRCERLNVRSDLIHLHLYSYESQVRKDIKEKTKR